MERIFKSTYYSLESLKAVRNPHPQPFSRREKGAKRVRHGEDTAKEDGKACLAPTF